MKIGILTERMLLGFGVDLVVHEQARRLGLLGHEVSVFVLRADPSAVGDHYTLNVLSGIVSGFADYVPPFPVRELLVKEFLKRVKAEAFDIWILHTPPFYQWIRFLEQPIVFIEYGTPPSHFFNDAAAYHLWKMVSEHFRNSYGLLRPSDAVISISQDIHNWLPEQLQSSSHVVLLGADHYGCVDRQSALAFRHSIGVEDRDCMILWVGRMQFASDGQPYKGFQELREMLPEIKTIASHVKVALLGRIDKEDQPHLDALGVIALANHPAAEMGAAYAAADVLLNLSKWEGFNLALAEAQYQGTPVVAYNLGPHKEITRPGDTAILVKSSDEIVPALTRLVEDVELRTSMSERSRIFAQNLTWDRNVEKITAVLENCCKLYNATPQARRDEDADAEVAPPVTSLPQIERLSLDRLLSLNGREFVTASYQTLLLRPPDFEGEAQALHSLQSGLGKVRILLNIARSEEGISCNAAPRRLRLYMRLGSIGHILAPLIENLRKTLRAVAVRI